MKRLLLVVVLATALLGIGATQAYAVDEYTYGVWKTGKYPGNYNDWFTMVGNVSLYRNGNTLQVSFWAWEGYELLETHVDVSPTLDGIPHNAGGPIPGKFDAGMEHDPPLQAKTYFLDVTGYPDPCYVVAHFVMRNVETGQIETGWATDCNTAQWEYPGANWARYVLLDGM